MTELHPDKARTVLDYVAQGRVTCIFRKHKQSETDGIYDRRTLHNLVKEGYVRWDQIFPSRRSMTHVARITDEGKAFRKSLTQKIN